MVKVRVSAQDTVLGAAVAALVGRLLPGTTVLPGRSGAADGVPGVRVALEGTDRWLFVAASLLPDGSAVEALSGGASAATMLGTPLDEFAKALKTLVEGGPGYVPIEMVRWMAGEALGRSPAASPRPGLTTREREILQLVARGCSNSEIGRELMISPNTVRTHLHALSVKLEATSRTKMLANARALAIPEAFDHASGNGRTARVSA
jgi:DNA-binding CsgD family transcriptional regulator